MIIERALQIHGWMTDAELTWLAEQASTRQRIVEVGCWQGRTTRALTDNTKGTVYAVDTWNGTPGPQDSHDALLSDKPADWLYQTFMRNLEDRVSFPPVVFAYRAPSLEAAAVLKADGFTADMIFIDAAHDYENVKADILAWHQVLAPGGLFCGHDYDGGRPGVMKAVNEIFPSTGHKKLGIGSLWMVTL